MSEPFSLEQLKQIATVVSGALQEERGYTRQMVREEVKNEVVHALEPLNEKLDQIRTAQIEDAAAVATDIVKLTRHSDDHEKRIKKLEQSRG